MDTELEDGEMGAASSSFLNGPITFAGEGDFLSRYSLNVPVFAHEFISVDQRPGKCRRCSPRDLSQATRNLSTATTKVAIASSPPTAPLRPTSPQNPRPPQPDFDASGNAGPSTIVQRVTSSHRGASLRDKVLKKTVRPVDIREDLAGDSSNVTSPSNTPEISTPPHAAAANAPPANAKFTREAKKTEKARREQELRDRKKEELADSRMTPSEYAAKVQTKFADAIERSTKKKLFLAGKRIFFITGDHRSATKTTRRRMDIAGFLRVALFYSF